MTPAVNIDTTVVQALPISKRLPKWILFMQSVCYPVKWLYNNVMMGLMNGTTTGNYDPATTYLLGKQVIYNFAIWESLSNGNTGNTPITGSTYWLLVKNSFIGATEQAKYSSSYLTLTWALNRYFQTTFRQPPYPSPYDFGSGSGEWSDIYITNYLPSFTSFVMYPTDAGSSDMYPGTSAPYILYDTPVYEAASSYLFIVHIPASLFASLGISSDARESVVNRFISRYIPCGLSFTIQTY